MDSAKHGPGTLQKVREYVAVHKLEPLFANATTTLIHNQPEDPKKFLAEFFGSVMAARDGAMPSACPGVVGDENIVSMFETVDVNNTGAITHKQYLEVMGNLGIASFNREPAGHASNKIYKEIFVQEAKAGLVASSATYAA